MTTLIHYSNKPLAAVRSVQQKSEPDWLGKPRGLWVSDGPAWRDWCVGEGFNLGGLKYPHQLILRDNANVLMIDSKDKFLEFNKTYGVHHAEYRAHLIDWHAVARHHDGIVIAPYHWCFRMQPETHWYYSWDCASGCIWRKEAVQAIEPMFDEVH